MYSVVMQCSDKSENRSRRLFCGTDKSVPYGISFTFQRREGIYALREIKENLRGIFGGRVYPYRFIIEKLTVG